MASAGRVLLISKGAWVSGTTYDPMDFVYYGGNTYLCKSTVSGSTVPSSDTTHWQVMASGFDVSMISQTIVNDADKIPSGAAVYTETQKLESNFAVIQASNVATQAFSVGEYLIYQGELYKVTSNIANGGTITPGTNCTKTNVGTQLDVLSSLKYQMGTVPVNTDLNTVLRVGIYTLNGNSNYTNAPINASMYGLLTVIRSGSSTSFITQIVTANGGKYFYRDTTNTGSSWTSWHELVHADTLTATSSSTLTKAFNSGTVDENACYKRYNVVNASFRQYGIDVLANGTVATLPTGYRPSTQQQISGFIRASGNSFNTPISFNVKTDGKVTLNYSSTSNMTQVGFAGTFII